MEFADTSSIGELSDGVASSAVEYHEASGTYTTEFDSHARPPSVAVVDAVAAAVGRDPLELPPLYSVLDTDALDALFASPANGQFRGPGSVAFEYADHDVTVRSHGTIRVEQASASDS
jgi:hypothetical protein